MPSSIRAAMQTDRGLVRDHNEDYIICREPASQQDEEQFGWLYIVADGVGGADAGEVASEYASQETVAHYLGDQEEPHPGRRLVKAMQAANTNLRQLVADRNDNKRMATTMVAVVIKDSIAYMANVGDSRGYHWRDDQLRQITRDQSLVAKLVEEGAITEEEAANHPHRNVILYSIGSEKTPQIDLFEVPLQAADRIFLCSDGLTRHVRDDEIAAAMQRDDLDASAGELIALAKERGGQDNISVAIISYGEPDIGATVAVAKSSVAMPAPQPKSEAAAASRAILVPFTAFLAVIEAVLIVMVWLLLRV